MSDAGGTMPDPVTPGDGGERVEVGSGTEAAAGVDAPPPPTPGGAAPVGGGPGGPGSIPQPLGPPNRADDAWTVPDTPRRLGWPFWLAIALGAVGTDLALRNPPWNNAAGTIGVLALVAALLLSGRVREPASRVALGLAAVLGVFLWFRTNPALVTFDIMAILGLIWVATVHGRGRSLSDTTPLRLLIRGAETLVSAIESIPMVGGELVARHRNRRGAGGKAGDVVAGVARGAMIAVPVLLVLGLLLASADVVFASFFSFSIGADVGPAVSHIVLSAIGAFIMVVLLRLSSRDLGDNDDLGSSPRLGLVEAMVVLISLDVLFAAFGVAQLLALSGGADEVLADAGLTVKEYARQGFFQLLWVAGLTAMVLIVLDVISRHHRKRGRTMVRVASLVAVALTFVIVGVAYNRLSLYIDYDGHTPLRFYSSVFSLWIAVVFVILAARIAGFRPGANWFTTAVGASAVVFLVGLNVANPEKLIVEENLARNDGQIVWHMNQFSADGNVVLADGIEQLPVDVQEDVLEKFCINGRREGRINPSTRASGRIYTGLSFNRTEQQLNDAYERLCAS